MSNKTTYIIAYICKYCEEQHNVITDGFGVKQAIAEFVDKDFPAIRINTLEFNNIACADVIGSILAKENPAQSVEELIKRCQS